MGCRRGRPRRCTRGAQRCADHLERLTGAFWWTPTWPTTGCSSRSITLAWEHPIKNPLGRGHPDFIEAVVAIHCQWVGHPNHATRPDSEVPVGISTHTPIAAHIRLSLLLQLCVVDPVPASTASTWGPRRETCGARSTPWKPHRSCRSGQTRSQPRCARGWPQPCWTATTTGPASSPYAPPVRVRGGDRCVRRHEVRQRLSRGGVNAWGT
jgi:hypothetical protein